MLSWRLSNTLDARFCVEALEEAITKYGTPEIMNTDQGSQYTGTDWITTLTKAEIKISMDGRGRYLDNIFIERLWRSLKALSEKVGKFVVMCFTGVDFLG